jgi:hypothetical protein
MLTLVHYRTLINKEDLLIEILKPVGRQEKYMPTKALFKHPDRKAFGTKLAIQSP